MDSDSDEFLPVRRGEPFTIKETNALMQEVRARKHQLDGKFQEVWKTWDEIANIVSTIEGIPRTGLKCRRRYNDVKRRGNQKMAAVKNCVKKPPSAPKPEKEHGPEFRGLEIGLHGNNSSHQYHTSTTQTGLQGNNQVHFPVVLDKVKQVNGKRVDAEEKRKTTILIRRTSSVNVLRPGDQLYLDLQQKGFNVLESELQGVRQVMASLHARMNSMEEMLRPIEVIADSLKRIASAMERLPRQ